MAKVKTVSVTVPAKLEGPPNQDAEEMTPALRTRADDLKTAIQELGRADALLRFQIGQVVLEISASPKKFGGRGVELLAREIGLDVSTVYAYATVSAAWSKREFSKLIKQVGMRGMPLSFSHFMAIAALKTKDRQNALLETAFSEGLSVRQLRDAVVLEVAPSTNDAQAGSDKTKQLALLVPPVKRWTAGIAKWQQTLGQLGREQLSPTSISRLRDTLAQQCALRDQLEKLIIATRALVGDDPAASASPPGSEDFA